MSRLATTIATLILLSGAASAHAEVLKLMTICPGQQLCPSFDLVLTPPQNWAEDKAASKDNRVQIMVPRGKRFGNADAVIYVKVSARQNNQTVEDFAQVSQSRWRESVPDTKIEKIEDIERGHGQPAFQSYRYENPSRPKQAFEAVSFGIDKAKDGSKFFVMVALTGQKKRAIDQSMTPYRAFLRAH